MITQLMSKTRYDEIVSQVEQFKGAIMISSHCQICGSGKGKVIVYGEGIKPCPLCSIYEGN